MGHPSPELDVTLSATTVSDVPSAPALVVQGPNRVGKYFVLRMLGQGGMGAVFAAYDESLDRKVALKLLHATESPDPLRRQRVLREAQALARVSHPNVVPVFEVGEHEAHAFIAMEFVAGTTLGDWRKGRSWREVLDVYRAAGEGLHAVHLAGLVHRDFKPDNVLVGADGRPRVVDFGLARSEVQEGTVEPFTGEGSPAPLSPLTAHGVVLGTPGYMSPEQYRGTPLDARSDQFSFCVALYEALYETLPFAGVTVRELRARVLEGRIEPAPRGSEVPASVRAALLRGLSVDAPLRFESMRELLDALGLDARDPAFAARSRRNFTIAGIGILILGSLLARLAGRGSSGVLLPSILVISCFLVATLALTFHFRRTLLTHPLHRAIVVGAVVWHVSLVLMRLLAILCGAGTAIVIAIDYAIMAAIGSMIAALALPRMWGVVAISLVAAVLSASYPEHAATVSDVLVPALAAATLLLWAQAARGSRKAGKSLPLEERSESA